MSNAPDLDEILRREETKHESKRKGRSNLVGIMVGLASFVVMIAAIVAVSLVSGPKATAETEIGWGLGAFMLSFVIWPLASIAHYLIVTRDNQD